jgi:hypothetical protein
VRAALSSRCSRERAADEFDESHRQRTEQADIRLARLASTRDELRDGRAFAHETSEVFRGRYRVNEAPQTVKRMHGKQRQRKKWTLFDSIWAPRAATSDARDFWDTIQVKRLALDHDWAIALRVRLHLPCFSSIRVLVCRMRCGFNFPDSIRVDISNAPMLCAPVSETFIGQEA